jgi:hypothetical protein
MVGVFLFRSNRFRQVQDEKASLLESTIQQASAGEQ